MLLWRRGGGGGDDLTITILFRASQQIEIYELLVVRTETLGEKGDSVTEGDTLRPHLCCPQCY